MKDISIDKLLLNAKNKFLLANAISERSKQISEGSLPYVDDFNPANPIVTALKEILADRIKIKALTGPAAKLETLLLPEEKFMKKRISLAKETKKKSRKK